MSGPVLLLRHSLRRTRTLVLTIGILLGAIIAFVVRHLIPSVPASLSLLWVVLGVGISLAVGIFFGYYPANRAANLDPIVALRYE